MITLHALDNFFLSSIGEWRLHIFTVHVLTAKEDVLATSFS